MERWAEKLSHIRAVLIEDEPGVWSAQCLDYDICAQAETFFALQDELLRVLATHVVASAALGREPFLGVKQAPRQYWDLFDTGLAVESRPSPIECETVALPPITPRLRIAKSPAVLQTAA